MALGGGVFTTQNKKIAGAYINFVSANQASNALSERGTCAIPMTLSWGEEDKIFLVEGAEFQRKSKSMFGYDYNDKKLLGLREVFKNAQKVYIYRLNTGTKAFNEFAEAKYSGIRGNDIKIAIATNVDEPTKFDVKTYLDNGLVDTQTVTTAAELVSNEFVNFKSDAELTLTAGTPLESGSDGSGVTVGDWQKAFAKLESYAFNTLAIVSDDSSVKDLAVAYTKRRRYEEGVKFQTVMHKMAADEKGIISVENNATSEIVYWVAGAQAGCAVNKSCTNKKYDGELTINVDYTQAQLEKLIDAGKFAFHRVGDDIRVLTDINSKVTVTLEEGEDFKANQTIRVIDQIGNDIATVFNTKYLGIMPNNEQGRISLWSDIVDIYMQLQEIQAIEGFVSTDLTVSEGNGKKDVVTNSQVKVTNAMEKMYMTVVVA